jgi:hypothetical protein
VVEWNLVWITLVKTHKRLLLNKVTKTEVNDTMFYKYGFVQKKYFCRYTDLACKNLLLGVLI